MNAVREAMVRAMPPDTETAARSISMNWHEVAA